MEARNIETKRVTMKDVAREAGVSENTVSRILGGKSGHKKSTADRVRETAERMGYKKSETAHDNTLSQSSLALGRTISEWEVARMNKLRASGWSNADIAQRTGRCLASVTRVIGAQPDEITAIDAKLRGKIVTLRREARLAAVAAMDNGEKQKLENEIRQHAQAMKDLEKKYAAKYGKHCVLHVVK